MKHVNSLDDLTEHSATPVRNGFKVGSRRRRDLFFFNAMLEEKSPFSLKLNSKILALDLYQSLYLHKYQLLLAHFILKKKKIKCTPSTFSQAQGSLYLNIVIYTSYKSISNEKGGSTTFNSVNSTAGIISHLRPTGIHLVFSYFGKISNLTRTYQRC